MSKTNIEWTDCSLNPIVGCSKCSQGCDNCYAESMAHRLSHNPQTKQMYAKVVDVNTGKWNGLAEFNEAKLFEPFRWIKPRKCFINSMGDLFHDSVPFEWVDQVMRMIYLTPKHTYQILTKRPERMLEYFKGLSEPGTDTETSRRLLRDKNNNYAQNLHGMHMVYLKGGALRNLWLGVSVENQETVRLRIPVLLEIPATIRFVSAEPLLEQISFRWIEGDKYRDNETGISTQYDALKRIDWIITGPENGHNKRRCEQEWIRVIAEQCDAVAVPIFIKKGADDNTSFLPLRKEFPQSKGAM